mgnify:CR=1 FL=1|tara:strand:- start:5997 stop:6413 length:417 start_codon:yes stop_codon:yes gene_type:complete
MKLTESKLKQMIMEVLSEGWRDTYWSTEDGIKVTIGEIDDYLGSSTIDIDPVKIKNQVLKSRGKDSLPVGPGITSQERVDKANLKFPIITAMKDGQYTYVLDGNHRLQKAVELDKPLKAKVLNLDDPKTPEKYRELFG